MTKAHVLGVIPARLGSERLARKPLHELAGRPLIEWVWRRARTFDVLDACIVATDSEEVAAVCTEFGAAVRMTAASHPSGTDRVAEVAAAETADVVVNIQGDEPFIEETHVRAAVELVIAGWPIGTVAAPVRTLDAWRDPSVVKVVRRADGGALYFSRAGIPFVRDRAPTEAELNDGTLLRHVGLYAYAPDALARWVALPAGGLEGLERLEQLRPLEAGLAIGVAVAEDAPGGVDTLEDARRAAARLAEEGLQPYAE